VPTAAVSSKAFAPARWRKWASVPTCCWSESEAHHRAVSGFGQGGPYRRRPGFGTLVEGMSGFASFNGFGDREPVLPPMYLADTLAGLYGSSAVMVALREIEQNGGKGQVIDLPLLDPMFVVLGPQAANYRLTEEGEAAHRQPLDERLPAQRVHLQGRALRRPVRVHAEDGRARVPLDRPRRPHRRSTLQDRTPSA
jgi:hypothetical protein